jgi:hypothetical protein
MSILLFSHMQLSRRNPGEFWKEAMGVGVILGLKGISHSFASYMHPQVSVA